jgi:hypothetical protein
VDDAQILVNEGRIDDNQIVKFDMSRLSINGFADDILRAYEVRHGSLDPLTKP